MTRLFGRALALVLFTVVAAAPMALAQQVAPQPPTDMEFTEDELDQFSEAYVDLQLLQVQYQNEHGDVQDEVELMQIQQQFQADAMQTLQESGIDPVRYEQIIVATQLDEGLAEEIVARIERVRAERGV
jgi:hypothetical protein